MDKMKIEIWSDIACPYCYIGKRKLEKALEQFPHHNNIELIWHSYELNPDIKKSDANTPYYSYIAGHFGISEEQARKSNNKISALANEVGLRYDFDNLVVANTSKALRLVKLAALDNLATEMEEALFKAYFTDGKNIGDDNVLIELGTQIGMDSEPIKELLHSDHYIADIKSDIEYSENELNLEYIPFYLFNNKHIVQGSIPVEDYLNILQKSYAEWEKEGVSSTRSKDEIKGQSCSIDGHCSL